MSHTLHRLALLASFALLLPGPATAASARYPDPGTKGPYQVGFTSVVLVDGSRPAGKPYAGRPIPLLVWYPADAASVAGFPEAIYPLDAVSGRVPPAPSSLFEKYGTDGAYQEPPVSSDAPFPLLIFSPGAGAIAAYHVSLGTRLASHGFIVAVPYHWGSGFWAWEAKYNTLADGIHRPLDMSFVLTTLLSYNDSPDHLLHGAVRPDQVAAGGWSLGGYTAMVLAGGDDLACDVVANPPPGTCVASMPDPRFRAIVSMDGSANYLHWSELARVTVPSLVMGREWSTLAALAESGAANADWITTSVARPHGAFGGHPNIRVDVLGTNHQSFSDFCQLIFVLRDMGVVTPAWTAGKDAAFCAGVTDSNEVHRLMGLYGVAFLRTALAREPGFDHYLAPGWALTREPLAEVFVTEKRSPSSAVDECMSSVVPCAEQQLFLYFPHQPGSEQARGQKDPVAPEFVEADDRF